MLQQKVILTKVYKFFISLKYFANRWLFSTNHKDIGISYLFFGGFLGHYIDNIKKGIEFQVNNIYISFQLLFFNTTIMVFVLVLWIYVVHILLSPAHCMDTEVLKGITLFTGSAGALILYQKIYKTPVILTEVGECSESNGYRPFLTDERFRNKLEPIFFSELQERYEAKLNLQAFLSKWPSEMCLLRDFYVTPSVDTYIHWRSVEIARKFANYNADMVDHQNLVTLAKIADKILLPLDHLHPGLPGALVRSANYCFFQLPSWYSNLLIDNPTIVAPVSCLCIAYLLQKVGVEELFKSSTYLQPNQINDIENRLSSVLSGKPYNFGMDKSKVLTDIDLNLTEIRGMAFHLAVQPNNVLESALLTEIIMNLNKAFSIDGLYSQVNFPSKRALNFSVSQLPDMQKKSVGFPFLNICNCIKDGFVIPGHNGAISIILKSELFHDNMGVIWNIPNKNDWFLSYPTSTFRGATLESHGIASLKEHLNFYVRNPENIRNFVIFKGEIVSVGGGYGKDFMENVLNKNLLQNYRNNNPFSLRDKSMAMIDFLLFLEEREGYDIFPDEFNIN